jgi:hypothetical protein
MDALLNPAEAGGSSRKFRLMVTGSKMKVRKNRCTINSSVGQSAEKALSGDVREMSGPLDFCSRVDATATQDASGRWLSAEVSLERRARMSRGRE